MCKNMQILLLFTLICLFMFGCKPVNSPKENNSKEASQQQTTEKPPIENVAKPENGAQKPTDTTPADTTPTDTTPADTADTIATTEENTQKIEAENEILAKTEALVSGVVEYHERQFTMRYPFFPKAVVEEFDKKTDENRHYMYLRYILIPHRLIDSFKADQNKYLSQINTWSSPRIFGRVNYFDFKDVRPLNFNDKSFSLDFTDANHPTMTVIQEDGTTLVSNIPLTHGDVNFYPFSEWSVTQEDVKDLNQTIPALRVEAGEEFHIFITLRTTGAPDNYLFYTVPVNFNDGLSDLVYTMKP